MHTRPGSLLAAVVLVALTGVAALMVAALLGAVAAGAIPFLYGLSSFAWFVAASTLVFGLAGVAAAVGLWLGRGWAWPVGVGVQLLGMLGAVVALATSGSQVPTLVGTLMVAAGLAAVAAPDTRRALAI